MKTTLAKAETTTHGWKIVDAKDQILGRLAVTIADSLRGRDKPIYTPHVDTGDYVVVINAEKVKLSGSKEEQKKYMFYSGYMGKLPKNKLADKMLKKLKVYKGAEHPHEAQQPVPLAT
jgi:large subunit ribosomal protein L13